MLVQYVFVPKKPKMSPGKIASQVAHATYLALKNENTDEWEDRYGMCVIVLQVKNQTELINVKHYLEQERFEHASYNDEGYTEVPPFTMTAVATGIVDKDKDGWRFKQFELYK